MHAKLLATTGALLVAPLYLALAGPVNQIVVFGDSLSDNGNAAIALAGVGTNIADLNYAPNAFTDGPNTTPATTGPFGLWVDQFAAKLGVPDPQPYLANPFSNTNYAVASAETGSANLQDIGNQLTAFGATHPLGAPSDALYAVWGGANDLYNGSRTGKAAADNMFGYILSLSNAGAKTFLWMNLPDLGATPRGVVQGAAALTAASMDFDAEWAIDLALLKSQGVNVIGVDINTLFNQITSNPLLYGFSNVTMPAQGANVNPNTYLFWDMEHPTTAGDALIANLAYADLNAPEPLSAGLMLIGIGAVLAAAKLRRKTAQPLA